MEKVINHNDLKKFIYQIFKKIGLDKNSRIAVTTGLYETSLRGVDSHGVRLLGHYVNSALNGRKNPKPNFKFFKTFPAVGVLDADNAFGHASGMKAIDIAMKMAKKLGVGIVSVKNSSHPGALAPIALKAARKKYIVFAFTHADSLMLSHNGVRPYFGTNPICFAAPRKEKEPYCVDMATSMISWNKLLKIKSENKSLKKNLAADSSGKETIKPGNAKSLLPAGSYKGFALASMVEVLCGVYSGMNFGQDIPPMYKYSIKKPRKLGQFYIVFKSNSAISKNEFLEKMQKLTQQVRNQKPRLKKNKVMMPNDPEILQMKIRKKRGIPLDNEVYKTLINLSKRFSVKIKIKK